GCRLQGRGAGSRRSQLHRGRDLVEANRSTVEGSARGVRAMEDRVQSLRSLVEERQVEPPVCRVETDIDAEWHSLDSTINRAHQHAAGGKGGLMRTRSAARVAGPRLRSTS